MSVKIHLYDSKGQIVHSYDAGTSIGGRRGQQTRRHNSVDQSTLIRARDLGLAHGRHGQGASSLWTDGTPYHDAYMSGYNSGRNSRAGPEKKT